MSPSSILDTLFPPTCLLCGAPGSRDLDLCDGCAGALPWNRHCCARCALPLDGAELDGALCGACQRRAPPYERCLAALRYETPVPNLVGAAKFRGRMNAVRLLGQLLARSVQAAGQPLPEVLVPVPLHRRRLAERGYNQALEIARVVARQLELPLEPGCCDRGVATLPQAGLDEGSRRRNIRGAFRARSPLGLRDLAIIDDVVTTGSTVEELARVLKRAGALHVQVWALARTP
ncbi:MAG: ComF family protein [Chromatiaceae bacterium]